MTNFSGKIIIAPTSSSGSPTAGFLRFDSGTTVINTGSTNASFNLGGGVSQAVLCTRNPETANVGELTGGPSTALEGPRSTTGKLNSARLLAMLPNTHGVAAQQEELGMRHRPMAIARPDITHAQSGFDNIPTGVQAVRSRAPTYNDRLAAKQHMLDMLRRRELGTSMTSPQAALKKGYLNLARATSQAQRSISRRNALDQLRGRLRGGDFAGGAQQLYTSSINQTSPEDGVWFDPHPATGPMACAPYPKTNGGWGADGGNHNPLWQFSAANRSSKSLVNEPYRVAYWTPHSRCELPTRLRNEVPAQSLQLFTAALPVTT